MPVIFEFWGFPIELDGFFKAFIILAVSDMLMGVSIALVKGEFKSDKFRKGLLKKVLNIYVIVLTDLLASVVGKEGVMLADLITCAFIAIEFSSIIEHLVGIGVPIPKGIYKIIGRFEDKDVEHGEQDDGNDKK